MAVSLLPAAPASAFHEKCHAGYDVDHLYVTMSDGVQLRIGLELPGGGWDDYCRNAPFPTVLQYSGYTYGYRALPHWEALVSAGYAIVAVAERGTGCSGGELDAFSEREREDIHELIRWISQQWWSDGGVALFGASYPGMHALHGAPRAPKQLKAVVAAVPAADLYRDWAFPGGIPNLTPAGLASLQAYVSADSVGAAVPPTSERGADTRCAAQYAESPGLFPAVEWMASEWDEGPISERSPSRHARDISVPMLLVGAWHDELLGSRAVDVLRELRRPYHAVLANGGHNLILKRRIGEEVLAFLDHYVKGVGSYDRPPVQIWWDTDRTGVARWTTSHGAWPIPQARARRLYLSGAGTMSAAAPLTAGTHSYAHLPGGGQSVGEYGGWGQPGGWQREPTPGAYRAYTYDVTDDLVVAGSASLDLWLSSTVPDTDVQVILTEIRDGEEIYVAHGALRASHRALDPAKSTATRPYHTHQAPGTPMEGTSLLRVEIMPFGHAFRKGTQLRVYVEAPRTADLGWVYISTREAAVNTIHYGGLTPSALVLPVVPDVTPDVLPTACDTAVRRLCRPAHEPVQP